MSALFLSEKQTQEKHKLNTKTYSLNSYY